jgi:hypothetical protein
MKPTLLVLLLGVTSAVTAHVAWFRIHQPCTDDQLNCQLSWMKAELKLTDEQFARIKEIHETSSPRLLALATQVARLRDEYAAFERMRVDTDHVDFVEFAHFVEQRREVNRACLDSTRSLVAATSSVMTPEQRQRYLGLLHAHGESAPN